MSTQDRTESPKLEKLGDAYEIIGELTGRPDARTYLAKRRDNGGDVLIVVSTTPQGDEGNALSHLAADVQRLSSARPRNLLPIVEGRWVDTDAFAIVMERPDAPTLAELLSRRDEDFGLQRIAAILRDANGVLDWARSQKIVHRAVNPKTVYVEPGSDRVLVSFASNSLPSSGAPGAEADARSIADLARAMLTRSPAAPERAEQPLAELRPSLPAALLEETEALLHPERAPGKQPDVNNYIARIAMADALKDGETFLEKTHTAIEEQQRVHREQLEKERREHEQQLSGERKKHEQMVADQARAFEKERDEFERELAKERKQLAKEREALAKERAAHAKDRAALVQERASHEQDRAALIQERLKHEQLTKEQRERLAAEAAAIEEEARRYAQTTEVEVPIVAEREEVADETRAAAASPVKAPDVPKALARPTRPVRVPTRPSAGKEWWKREVPTMPAVAALVLIIAIAATTLGRHRAPPALAQASHQVPASVVVDSASGAVFSSVVPLPDSATAAAAADSARLRRARRAAAAAAAARKAEMSASQTSSPAGFVLHPEGAKPDSTVRLDSVGKPITSPKRDTVPKADTLPKKDTTSIHAKRRE